MKIEAINWRINFIHVVCEQCKKDFKIIPTSGEMEKKQAEYGEAELDGICPFCEHENKVVIDLEDFSYAI